jgi:hypothetical protein
MIQYSTVVSSVWDPIQIQEEGKNDPQKIEKKFRNFTNTCFEVIFFSIFGHKNP